MENYYAPVVPQQKPASVQYGPFPVFLLVAIILRMCERLLTLIPSVNSLIQMIGLQAAMPVVLKGVIGFIPLIIMLVGVCLHRKGMQFLLGIGILVATVFELFSTAITFMADLPEEELVRQVLPLLVNIPLLIFSLFIALYYITKGRGIGKPVKIVFGVLSLVCCLFSQFLQFMVEVGLNMETTSANASYFAQTLLIMFFAGIVVPIYYIAIICYSPFSYNRSN